MGMRYRRLLPFVAMLLLLSPGCSRNPVTGQREFVMYSQEEEIQLGTESHPLILEQLRGVTDDQALQDYVRSVGCKIAKCSDREMPYEFYVVNAPWANACAAPGGRVYVNLGIFPYLRNERELAALLGHEVGHVAARHGVKKKQWTGLAGAAVKEVWTQVRGKTQFDEAITQAAAFGLDLLNKRYSRKQEYQADHCGILYSVRAGYNGWATVELLQQLSQLAQKDQSVFDEMFYTHPLFPNRIEAAEAEVRSLAPNDPPGAPPPNDQQFSAMKKRALDRLSKYNAQQIDAEKKAYREKIGRGKLGHEDDDPESGASGNAEEARSVLKEFAQPYFQTAQRFWAAMQDGQVAEAMALTSVRFNDEMLASGPQELRKQFLEHGRCELLLMDCAPHKDRAVGLSCSAEYPDGAVILVEFRFVDDKIDALSGRRMK